MSRNLLADMARYVSRYENPEPLIILCPSCLFGDRMGITLLSAGDRAVRRTPRFCPVCGAGKK